MEWVQGKDLDAWLEEGALPLTFALGVALQLASALAAVHAHGVVHRDVKPANILIASREPLRLKLVDFGVAHDPGASTKLTATGAAIGTPLYMAPEQIRGHAVSGRTDVYALGAVLFEMLSGRPPFEGEAALAVLGRILLEPAPPLHAFAPHVSARLSSLVASCLSKDPLARPSAEELCRQLSVEAGASLEHTAAPPGGADATIEQDGPVVAPIATELLSAAVVVVRDASMADVERVPSPEGTSWGRLRDGTIFGLFVTPETPDEAMVIALRAAFDLGRLRAAARLVVCAGRRADNARGFVGEIFARAAADEPSRPGVYADIATAELLSRRCRVESEGGPLRRLFERELDDEPLVLGLRTPTVGREAELAQLEALFRAVASGGRPRAALVLAPPGQGKSRVRRDLRALVGPVSRVVSLTVQFHPLSAAAPLHALGEGLLRGCPEGIVSALAPLERAALHRMGRVASVDEEALLDAVADSTEASKDLARAALVQLLRRLAAATAALVLLEDAHWADAATMKLVDQLLSEEELPVAIVAFARPEIDERFPQLWARRSALRLPLGPLSRRAAASLVRVIAPASSGHALEQIVELAAGSPLILEELSRQYVRTGAVAATSSAQQVFEAELASLPADERLVLRAASLVGEVFWPACVVDLLREAPIDVSACLERLEGRELIVPHASRIAGEPARRVRHALLREAALEATEEAARRALHGAAAAWFSQFEAESLLLAHHAECAGQLDVSARAYERAALDAADDVEAAVVLMRKALALLPPSAPVETRARILLGLEDLERATGDEDARSRALERLAAESPTPQLRLEIAVREARRDVDRRSSAAALRALSIADDAKAAGVERLEGDALLVAARGLLDAGDPERALKVLYAALTGSENRFDGRVQSELHRVLGVLLRRNGDVEGAICAYKAAIQHAGESAVATARVAISLGYLQLTQGYVAEARASFESARVAMDRVGLRRDRARLEANFAHLALTLGAPNDAIAHLDRARALHAQGVDGDALVETECLRVHAALDLGDVVAARLALANVSSAGTLTAYEEAHAAWLSARILRTCADAGRSVERLTSTLAHARRAKLSGFVSIMLAERVAAYASEGDDARARQDAREALSNLELDVGADFALDVLAEVDCAYDEGLERTARGWLDGRIARAGQTEAPALARNPRWMRIEAALAAHAGRRV